MFGIKSLKCVQNDLRPRSKTSYIRLALATLAWPIVQELLDDRSQALCCQRVIFGDQLGANFRQVQQQGGDEASTVLPVFTVDQDHSPYGGDRAHDGRRRLGERAQHVAVLKLQASELRQSAVNRTGEGKAMNATLESLLSANGFGLRAACSDNLRSTTARTP